MSTAWRLDISHGLRSEPSLVEYYPRKEISSLLLKIQVSVDRWTYQLYLKHCLPNGCVPWLLFFSLSWPHPGPWPHFLFEYRVPRVLTHVYVCAHSLSCIWLFVTPWTVDHKAPLSMEFSRQEYWIRLPFLPPGDLPNPGIEPLSTCLLHAGGFFTTEAPRKLQLVHYHVNNDPAHMRRYCVGDKAVFFTY